MKPLSLLSLGLVVSTAVLLPLQTAEARHNDHYRGHSGGPGFFFNFSPPPIYIAPSRPVPVYVERHNLVLDVQAALTRRGYEVGGVDGVYGQQTRNALLRFQSDAGLRATGEINDATLRALGL